MIPDPLRVSLNVQKTDYSKLLVRTNFMDMRDNILKNFVGTTGWLDTFLPPLLVYLYLLLLIFTALTDSASEFRISVRNKIFFFVLFLTGLLAIETSMYFYATYVGMDKIFGIQGRYFIPLAPLFFLLFQNPYLVTGLNILVSRKKKEYVKAKDFRKEVIYDEIIYREKFFTKLWSLFLTVFSLITLLITIIVVFFRYYIP